LLGAPVASSIRSIHHQETHMDRILSASRWLIVAIVCCAAPLGRADTAADNGIHVGRPKVYDNRELTLLLDSLFQQLPRNGFVDPKALAAALGNLQGFQNSDTSFALSASGAVGPGAANIFSGTAPAAALAPTDTSATAAAPASSPSFTINVSPSLTAGTGTTAASTSGTTPASPMGPQPPSTPSLQTAPSYTPNFGVSASDLLSEQVNLTYQITNISMLLNRSLTDRLYPGGGARLQAVMSFDVDLEPDKDAKDEAAVIELTVKSPADTGQCDAGGMSLIALMPEAGSHNAATLSQKANAFGGAIAASVFSVGASYQSRSQVFYLYRDMDTVSFQRPAPDGSVTFGWQFRPVLGRHAVESGMRHMMVVLGLPCADRGNTTHTLQTLVATHWQPYDGSTQTTSQKKHWWSKPVKQPVAVPLPNVQVLTATQSQHDLGPHITDIQWIPTDTNSGVAVVTGDNFFSNTVVRIGGKTYSTAANGLTIKSDQVLEVTLPTSAALTGGILSGRYGGGVPLEPNLSSTGAPGQHVSSFHLGSVRVYPTGDSLVQVYADLIFESDIPDGEEAGSKLDGELAAKNPPVLFANTTPVAGILHSLLSPLDCTHERDLMKKAAAALEAARSPAQIQSSEAASKEAKDRYRQCRMTRTWTGFATAKSFTEDSTLLNMVFPFAGPQWIANSAYYQPSLKVTRLGSDARARLLIRASNAADFLCDAHWRLQLDDQQEFPLLNPHTHVPPASGGLHCADPAGKMLSFELPAKTLKAYHRFMLVNDTRAPLIGEIPGADPAPPGPTLDKDQSVSVAQNDVHPVTFKGKHLDEVTKVLFDTQALSIVSQSSAQIVISLSPAVTSKPRGEVGLQLISEGHDPLIAKLIITAPKTPTPPGVKGK
jgi:hypothetical protein